MTVPRKRAPRKTAAPQSQRDRLLRRPRPSTTYRLLVDPEALEPAQAALREQERTERQVRLRANSTAAQKKAAAGRLDAARAAVDVCYETIVLRALPTAGPLTFESIVSQHPATPEQMDKAKAERQKATQRGEELPPWPQWAPAVWPALLAACAEGDMTEQDWTDFLAGNVSDGELAGLKRTVLTLNESERAADPALPFDLTQILSSGLNSR